MINKESNNDIDQEAKEDFGLEPTLENQVKQVIAEAKPIRAAENDAEKVERLSNLLGIEALKVIITEQGQQIDQVTKSISELSQIVANNAGMLQSVVNHINGTPGQTPGQTPGNQDQQMAKLGQFAELIGVAAEAYAKIKRPQIQQGEIFDFKTFAVDFVGKMLNTQMDALAMNAYQAPLKPPSWFANRGYNNPQPEQVKKPNHQFE